MKETKNIETINMKNERISRKHEEKLYTKTKQKNKSVFIFF